MLIQTAILSLITYKWQLIRLPSGIIQHQQLGLVWFKIHEDFLTKTDMYFFGQIIDVSFIKTVRCPSLMYDIQNR